MGQEGRVKKLAKQRAESEVVVVEELIESHHVIPRSVASGRSTTADASSITNIFQSSLSTAPYFQATFYVQHFEITF
ncbi:AAA family ATPase [Aspergillus luchuensis]|uniref:AAA family ATPase n=1 Tax=Aspergillus kawachii TaxID=1069201 RepID=A0A146F8U9_ASPKA|nr:AAA family ATPase [Aspergillus luchuensis]